MLQGILIKKVLDLVLKQIFKKFDLNKINKYVEEDNELDIQMKEIEKKITILEKDSHPPIKNLEKRIKRLEKRK